ncbi:MAG: hypothetical protein A2X47_11585 [Lentisphaerae bacterium GWF2_38_69]|nr:MAG: hypothetical protein A2X47_11585 [Lentisphaerae bacterium GWF2_38_69]
MINSKIHVNDSDFALDKGLFSDDFKSYHCKVNGHPGREDFIEFGKRIGVSSQRIEKLLKPFLERQSLVETLIGRSFLNDSTKKSYLFLYNTKRNYFTQL